MSEATQKQQKRTGVCVYVCLSLLAVWLAVCGCILGQQQAVVAAASAQHHDKLGTRCRRLVPASTEQTSEWASPLLLCPLVCLNTYLSDFYNKQSLLRHLLNIMTSWVLFVDIWYLLPQNRQTSVCCIAWQLAQRLWAASLASSWMFFIQVVRGLPELNLQQQPLNGFVPDNLGRPVPEETLCLLP